MKATKYKRPQMIQLWKKYPHIKRVENAYLEKQSEKTLWLVQQ